MRRARRLGLFAIGGLALAGIVYAALVVRPRLQPIATIASGYMARVTCACHFIGGRSLSSCLTDRESGMERVRVSIDTTARRATASVPFLASVSATHTPGLGCVVDR